MDCGFLSSYNKSIWQLTLELITCIFQVYVLKIKHLHLHQSLQALEVPASVWSQKKAEQNVCTYSDWLVRAAV